MKKKNYLIVNCKQRFLIIILGACFFIEYFESMLLFVLVTLLSKKGQIKSYLTNKQNSQIMLIVIVSSILCICLLVKFLLSTIGRIVLFFYKNSFLASNYAVHVSLQG